MDVETTIEMVLRELLTKHGFRLPVHVATLGANGASLITRVESPPPGAKGLAVALTHVAGDVGDEGFSAPLHLLLTDALGQVRVAVHRGSAAPNILIPRAEHE